MEAELRVEVTMRKGMHAGDPVTVGLRVEDAASGEVLVSTDFTANQWLELTSSSSLRVPGFVTSHPERVGRKMQVRQVYVPKDQISGYDREENKAQALAWAQRAAEHGEVAEVRNTNRGWAAIFRTWLEVV